MTIHLNVNSRPARLLQVQKVTDPLWLLNLRYSLVCILDNSHSHRCLSKCRRVVVNFNRIYHLLTPFTSVYIQELSGDPLDVFQYFRYVFPLFSELSPPIYRGTGETYSLLYRALLTVEWVGSSTMVGRLQNYNLPIIGYDGVSN